MNMKFLSYIIACLVILGLVDYFSGTPVDYNATNKNICRPVCEIFCLFGNVLDDKGCPICACKSDPNHGDRCPPVCDVYCLFGNVLDEKGCPTCDCKSDPILSLDGDTPKSLISTNTDGGSRASHHPKKGNFVRPDSSKDKSW
ncbi:antistasin-like isoform X4 [Gordionus sp. m RMFG-2023]|uniref:antistasin-like isoform X4 n=1 Tax=Gordionus sp. m RMFG-2023 TaxID=3053472 RepID=UPI0031FBDA24